MLKLKYILNDIIDHAYTDDPKLPRYKSFYVEYLRKRLNTKNGDYNCKDHRLRIYTKGREDVQVLKTSIHELSHHIDYMRRGDSCHDEEFYSIYRRLLYAALDMGLFDRAAYRMSTKDSSDDTKVLKMLERYRPRKTEYKKGMVRIRVRKAFKVREQLRERGYTYNAYDRTWEKETKGEKAASLEERFLRRLGAEFCTEDARKLTF